jgi:hypothetical protein
MLASPEDGHREFVKKKLAHFEIRYRWAMRKM